MSSCDDTVPASQEPVGFKRTDPSTGSFSYLFENWAVAGHEEGDWDFENMPSGSSSERPCLIADWMLFASQRAACMTAPHSSAGIGCWEASELRWSLDWPRYVGWRS